MRYRQGTAVTTLAMLADRTRLQLLWLLSRGEHDVGTLADLTDTTPSAASQHLAKLRLAGLVSVRQDGRKRASPPAAPTCASSSPKPSSTPTTA